MKLKALVILEARRKTLSEIVQNKIKQKIDMKYQSDDNSIDIMVAELNKTNDAIQELNDLLKKNKQWQKLEKIYIKRKKYDKKNKWK